MNNSNDDFLNENMTVSNVGSNSADIFSITIPSPVDTISLDNLSITSSVTGSSYFYNTGAGMAGVTGSYTTITGGASGPVGTITISDGTNSINSPSWEWIETVPFETGFPEWADFQAMCKEYPGLEKTFEHLKAFYKLCKDEWESKKKGENG